MIKVQAYQVLSILNDPRRSKWPNFASLHIWFATSWLSLKFVSLFYLSMFLWILKIHVAFDVLCSCIYIYIFKFSKKKKKKSRFPNLSQKKRKFFKLKKKKKKGVWTRGIEPLSHFKKILWTRGIELPSDFFKKGPFFFFQRFQDSLKSSFQNGTWRSLGQNFF